MDFRMDKISWVLIAVIVATMFYFLVQGMGMELMAMDYIKALGIALIVAIVLIALMCIPVLIYCYFVKMIPDIDYSIRAAFAFTVVGIISELIM